MKSIFVAIDTPELERAVMTAHAVRDHAGGIKLGLEFFSAHGPDGVRRIADEGLPVFLDLKLHDIPNTVSRTTEALAPLQPAILTVHAQGGHAMLSAAKRAAPPSTKVIAVTLLTSLDESDLRELGVERAPAEHVAGLAAVARNSGVDGIVCSGAEVAEAKKAWPAGFFVVPGVRPAGAEAGDQKRVVTPMQAINQGASILVIGRPITDAVDPRGAIMDIAAELSQMPAHARI